MNWLTERRDTGIPFPVVWSYEYLEKNCDCCRYSCHRWRYCSLDKRPLGCSS